MAATRAPVVIVVLWAEQVLEVRTLQPRQSLRLDELASHLPLPPATLAGGNRPLVLARQDAARLILPRGARGWVQAPGRAACSLEQVRHCGHPYRSAPRATLPAGTELPVTIGFRARLELGPLTLLVSRSPLASTIRRGAPPPPIEPRLAACLGLAAAVMLSALVAAAQLVRPLRGDEPTDSLHGPASYNLLVLLDDAQAEASRGPSLSREPTEQLYAEPGEPLRCCGDEPLGHPESLSPTGRYGVSGPADNPDPHIGRSRGGASGEIYPFALLDADRWPCDGPVAPWGRDDALGTDPTSARGALWGETLADAPGHDGMGRMRIDGGLSKALGPVGQPPDGTAPTGRVLHQGLDVHGPLAPSQILPVLAARFPLFRGCYQAALARSPELAGELVVQLEVEPSGACNQVRVARSTVGDEHALACLLGAFAGLSFPPSAQGASVVSYPLVLSPR